MKKYTLLFFVSVFIFKLESQILFINSGAEMYFGSTSSVGILDTLINRGAIRFAGSYGADFNMKGNYWANQNAGILSGKAKVKFNGSNTQFINTNSPTGFFPSIEINNGNNLHLTGTDTDVQDSVNFVSGKIILNKNDLNLGNGSNGVITGYDENKYFVTNALPTDTTKGFLKRDAIGASTVVFPIGTSISSYTPASMLNNGTADNYRMRVFDSAYKNATNGNPQVLNSVNKTWHILEATAGGTNAILKLQHQNSTEGSSFTAGKSMHFNTYFVGTTNNTAGDTFSKTLWANYKPSSTNTGSHTASGTITTGTAISGATTTTNDNMTNVGFWSKSFFSANLTPLPVELISFQIRRNDHLSAKLEWTTASEKENKGFQIQKSRDAIHFTDWKWVNGAGTTASTTSYLEIDYDCSYGHNYYRLLQIDMEGSSKTLPIRSIFFKSEEAQPDVIAYPTSFERYIHLDLINLTTPAQIEIIDFSGKRIRKHKILDSSATSIDLDLENILTGNYLLNVISGEYSKTIKLQKK